MRPCAFDFTKNERYYSGLDGKTTSVVSFSTQSHSHTKESNPMGNTKRQMLTAVVSLSLFILGSASVATAGLIFPDPGPVEIITRLEGNFKGKQWCAAWGGLAFSDEQAQKEKVKDGVTVRVEFSEFPFIEAIVTGFGDVVEMYGYAVRQKGNKGFFTLHGYNDVIDILDLELFMNGKYKAKNGVPTKLTGKWFAYSHLDAPVIGEIDPSPLDRICTTQTGSFTLKGDGNKIIIPIPDA